MESAGERGQRRESNGTTADSSLSASSARINAAKESNHTEKGDGRTLFERLARKRMQMAPGATELG
eukprot:CAMPEP_0172556672 /NCGR_PEP_ID=MMETSP1067-20121228/68142_1 /TAXON_ID=265564 ORGANISM="Thalassiosira punctigera, Strain Tpunct2005C2" /NCGR_SAMPLE_ID=MMETSP1067 /ASSEMBLY_ACC=CAM_ASM_000444 /LENGTH=65 /DNA_ID=CAMNT_0013345547 /DNA_START=38 /DNA_END=233 /DNA_ORIENTATION=-